MKIAVDLDLCEANGYCVRAAPEVFRVDEQDKIHLLVAEPGPELADKVKAAVRRCPRGAIKVAES